MLNKWSCVSALVACLVVQTASARNIFVTSPDPNISTIAVYTSEPLSFAGNVAGPAGAGEVLSGPGGKYYVVGRTASDGVVVLQGTFPSLSISKRIATASVPTAAALSPDGRRLVVIYPGGVQVIDTTSDNIIAGSGINVGNNPSAVAISTDSQRAFIAAPELQRIIALNLESGASAGEVAIQGQPVAVNVGPNSLVYASVQNAIYQIDPQALQVRATFSLNGFPGQISFTPDGLFGVAINTNVTNVNTGRSAYLLDLTRRTVADIPANGIAFSKIVVADNGSAYALSKTTSRVYQINLLSATSAPTLYNPSGITLESVRDITLSDEAPNARSLYVVSAPGLYKIDLASNTAIGPLAVPAPTAQVSYAGPAATGAVATLLQINNSQTVAAGAAALPLRVRAVNAQGVPVSGVAITFSTEVAGVSLSPASATTDLLGYAQTAVNIPSSLTTGVVPVTAAGGGQTTSFTLNVSSGTTDPGTEDPNAAGLQILSGQGQITSVGFLTPQPMTVIVRDATGNPVPNVPITWTITEGTGGLGNDTTYATDTNGTATATYSNFLVPLGLPYSTAVISASTGTRTVNFVVTTVANLPSGARGEATFTLRKPTQNLIVARAGESVPAAIEVAVGSLQGGPIPNVGLRITTPEGGPTATCQGGIPLSNSNGIVACDLVAGSVLGETQLRAIVGETAVYTFALRVEAGAASTLRVAAGNNQTANVGQPLANPLQVEVLDAAGNPLPGQVVNWEPVSPNSATVSPTSSTTDERGRATTRVTLGQIAGLVQIRARVGSATATFSATASVAGASLQVGGGGQSAAAGRAFANPITATVRDAAGSPVSGTAVQFQVTSGSATVPATATTNAQGVATATVTAGQTPGPVVITVRASGLTQTINLTVTGQGPSFTAAGIVNAAGYQPGISPGSIAVINATGIATDIRGSVTPQTVAGPLPLTLAGVEVLFNGVPAPIYSVSNINGQESVIVQVPFETTPGAVPVTVRTSTAGSTTVEGVQVQAVKPGLFDFVDTNGRRYAVAVRPDGSYVGTTNPARRGETVRVFATGLGQTMPAAGTNRVGIPNQNVAATVIAGINNEGVRLVSAKLMEGTVGVYIVEMEIPADTTPGDARNIAIAVTGPDGNPVFAGATIPIQ